MLNENIKAIRRSKGLSQQELAVKLNVVRQTVSKWEQGLSVPDADLLIALSEALVSRNRIRVKERDGKSETGKGRESQSYQGKQRTSMRRPPRRGRALSSSTRTAARGSSGGFLYS